LYFRCDRKIYLLPNIELPLYIFPDYYSILISYFLILIKLITDFFIGSKLPFCYFSNTSNSTNCTNSSSSSYSSYSSSDGNSSNSSTPTESAFPRSLEFTDLHLAKNLKAAKETLSGKVGVNSIICNVTGARYIGSSIDIGNRLVDHLVDNNTNEHLQNAINKYGLENFTFTVVEFCDPIITARAALSRYSFLFTR